MKNDNIQQKTSDPISIARNRNTGLFNKMKINE